jgi:hypothetical protein
VAQCRFSAPTTSSPSPFALERVPYGDSPLTYVALRIDVRGPELVEHYAIVELLSESSAVVYLCTHGQCDQWKLIFDFTLQRISSTA